jgi:hypothetical protein
MHEDDGTRGRQPAEPAASGAKPVRLGVYDRPAAADRGRQMLYLALAVIVAAVIAWLLFARHGAAAAPLLLA